MYLFLFIASIYLYYLFTHGRPYACHSVCLVGVTLVLFFHYVNPGIEVLAAHVFIH